MISLSQEIEAVPIRAAEGPRPDCCIDQPGRQRLVGATAYDPELPSPRRIDAGSTRRFLHNPLHRVPDASFAHVSMQLCDYWHLAL